MLIDRLNICHYCAIYMTYETVFSTNRFPSHKSRTSLITVQDMHLVTPRKTNSTANGITPHDQSCSSCEGLNSVLSSIAALLRDKAGGLADEEGEDILASRPSKPSMIGKFTNFSSSTG